MPEPSNSPNPCSSWRPCRARSSARPSPRWTMRATLRTSSCSSGTSTCAFGTAFSKIRSNSNPSNPRPSPNSSSSNEWRTGSRLFLLLLAISLFPLVARGMDEEREQFMPTKCESCLIFAAELEADAKRLSPKMPREEAEAWLLDELEQLCERMLAFRVHKERTGLARFAKQMTGTAKTIRELKQRGVEVKLDVDDELLDRPSIESGRLKEHCEWILEQHEEAIERWFLDRRGKQPLQDFICRFDGGCAGPDGRKNEL